ncbi:CAP family protein, partial [Crocosphaera chwakensis]
MKPILTSLIIFTSLLTVRESVVSQTNFKEQILTAHNQYRQQVNITSLSWSDQLANDAQTWSNHLASLGGNQLQHDPNIKRQGENLWLGTSNRFTYKQMVDYWGQEKQYLNSTQFNLETVSSTGNWSDVAHYTQMVWKNTKQVGCAVSTAGNNDILVCRYSPPGNITGQRI